MTIIYKVILLFYCFATAHSVMLTEDEKDLLYSLAAQACIEHTDIEQHPRFQSINSVVKFYEELISEALIYQNFPDLATKLNQDFEGCLCKVFSIPTLSPDGFDYEAVFLGLAASISAGRESILEGSGMSKRERMAVSEYYLTRIFTSKKKQKIVSDEFKKAVKFLIPVPFYCSYPQEFINVSLEEAIRCNVALLTVDLNSEFLNEDFLSGYFKTVLADKYILSISWDIKEQVDDALQLISAFKDKFHEVRFDSADHFKALWHPVIKSNINSIKSLSLMSDESYVEIVQYLYEMPALQTINLLATMWDFMDFIQCLWSKFQKGMALKVSLNISIETAQALVEEGIIEAGSLFGYPIVQSMYYNGNQVAVDEIYGRTGKIASFVSLQLK